jgi:hypothetical protein
MENPGDNFLEQLKRSAARAMEERKHSISSLPTLIKRSQSNISAFSCDTEPSLHPGKY